MQSFKNTVKEKAHLNLVYANVRGLLSKLPCVKEVLDETQASIACLTETHLAGNGGINVEGYTFFGKAREGKKGGGVGLLVKNSMKACVSPHPPMRDLELMWVSVNIKSAKPVYIGTYYGKQEGERTEEITDEMDNLCDEIKEVSSMGEVILCMDANAKIGLMGEPMSRNGKLLADVFQECELIVMNEQDICTGVVTRQNRRKETEKSAIDFIVATYSASQWFQSLKIDELGDYRIRNKNDSDHNTIIAGITIKAEQAAAPMKKESDWNYRAPAAKWEEFQRELRKDAPRVKDLMARCDLDITQRYAKWEKMLYSVAMKTIGRTTKKRAGRKRTTNEVLKLRKEKKECKKEFEKEKDTTQKGVLLQKYIQKQKELIKKIEEEEEEELKNKFEKVVNDANSGGFWRERRALGRDEGETWITTKGPDGHRILDPEENKENIATYYEGLYKSTPVTYHPYHDVISSVISKLTKGHSDEQPSDNDRMPTRLEIKTAIESKKDKKATTDWKNKLLKRGGDAMVEFIAPVIKAVWREETAPSQWNLGIITNIWKGKGDRERLENYRGITVSSSIGTIVEEIINNRLLNTVTLSQAQAGGKKGASTIDQLFILLSYLYILRSVMAIAKKEGRQVMVSFFDVKKAYDRADMDDMLFILHENGFQGKIWRLTKAMNCNLTAKVKTKAGLTREIKRETGGKQGGKLMVPMFAKMMDVITDDLTEETETGIHVDGVKIPALLLMDDLVSFSEGYDCQSKTLGVINEFGLKHKIEWGAEKCKVMELGTHKERIKEWELGEKTITTCKSYKHLGEIISRDGKNEANLDDRFKKVKSATRAIKSCGKTRIMRRIEVSVILKLHDAVTLPTLLYGCETWPLNSTSKKFIDKMEIWAWKNMLGLPKTTPTPAIMVISGSLFASIRVQIKQLLYLQKILQRPNQHWTYVCLRAISHRDVGWAKQVSGMLNNWGLETSWDNIKTKTKGQWKREVTNAAEKMNKKQILDECYKKVRGETSIKSKTKRLIPVLEDDGYLRQPAKFMRRNNVLITRAYVMGRYGMLQCAANFSDGYKSKLCTRCNVTDNEDHRMNNCPVWSDINLYGCDEKINFEDIHSDNEIESMTVVKKILEIWDLGNNKNSMRNADVI